MSERDHEPTPEAQARLRRLLADARHGDPIPVDVAARLDRVLDQLAHEPPQPVEAPDAVVDLAARRRRRVTGLLVAAAAVVVLGVGIGQSVRSSDSDSQSADAGSSAPAGAAAPEAGAADSAGGSALANGQQDVRPGEPAPTLLGPTDKLSTLDFAAPIQLSERGFARQVARYRNQESQQSSRRPTGPSLQQPAPDQSFGTTSSFLCQGADFGAGRLVAAFYDQLPSVLAYRPRTGSTQTVELLRCGTGEVLRSTVLAQP